MLTRKVIHTLFGVALVGVLATSSIGAIPNANRTTYFTFSKAVQLPGVALSAGSYVFEVVNPETGGSVVRVASRDRSKIYLTQVTLPVERPRSRDMAPRIVLGEAPAGQPPPVASWFPHGETIGRAFIY
ncbi:MAG: hypothetical protein EHM55_05555 [Acidobacteria bacterium]|nr:MAG: hypothetical protein EHM55_05555 [Acidobacteriota bacterium]